MAGQMISSKRLACDLPDVMQDRSMRRWLISVSETQMYTYYSILNLA